MQVDEIYQIRKIGFVIQTASLTALAIIVMKDIFESKHDLMYSLLGASTLFLMIGTCFGCLYGIFESFFPGMLAEKGHAPIINQCLNYSF